VESWNERAHDLWGLRPDEVRGRHFTNLDIGLPGDRLMQGIRDCLSGRAEAVEIVLPATNRRGRQIECKITAMPMRDGDGTVHGIILLMEELDAAGG
jgi:two-component system CheB/CheR fusion protein